MRRPNGVKTLRRLDDAKHSVANANIIVTNLLFLEEHTSAILPDLIARRDDCDAMINVIADSEIVKLTKMGDLDMSKPASGADGPAEAAASGRESQQIRRKPDEDAAPPAQNPAS